MELHVDVDVIGAIEGSDKSSSISRCWDYLRHYERLFAEYRDKPINLLEVGVQRGPSLRVWEWYFSQARIVGLDINPACKILETARTRIEVGSQFDAAFLAQTCETYPPTIFIDDGSHLAEHMIFTFEQVFPKVVPGGIYVCEDFALHTGDTTGKWQTSNPRDAAGYFANLARERLVHGHTAREYAELPHIAQIDSITMIGSAVIFRKKDPVRDLATALATVDLYNASHPPHAMTHERLAAYLVQHKGPLERADQELRKAIEMGGTSTPRLILLSEIRAMQGNNDAARAALVQAADHDGASAGDLRMIASMQGKLGDLENAVATAQRAMAKAPQIPSMQATHDALAARLAAGGKAGGGKKKAAKPAVEEPASPARKVKGRGR